MICTCVRTCRGCDHQRPPPPSRPGRSELGWSSSRPSIPQEPVPPTRAPARRSSVGNPVHEGAISSRRLTQEELKHRRSLTYGPTQDPPLPGHLAPPPRDVMSLHPPPAVVCLQTAVDLLISQKRGGVLNLGAPSNVAGPSLGPSHPWGTRIRGGIVCFDRQGHGRNDEWEPCLENRDPGAVYHSALPSRLGCTHRWASSQGEGGWRA